MIIKENITIEDYDNSYRHLIVVETDSTKEREMILDHLSKATQDYANYLRGFTKAREPFKADVVGAVRVDEAERFALDNGKYSAILCPQCKMVVFFEAPKSGRYKVKCPNPKCRHEQITLVDKGANYEI